MSLPSELSHVTMNVLCKKMFVTIIINNDKEDRR